MKYAQPPAEAPDRWLAINDRGEVIGIFATEAEASDAGRAWLERAAVASTSVAEASRDARPPESYRREFSLLRRTLARLRAKVSD